MTREQARRAKVGERVLFCGRKGDEGFVLSNTPAGIRVRWPSGVETLFSGPRLRSIEPLPPTIGAFRFLYRGSYYAY